MPARADKKEGVNRGRPTPGGKRPKPSAPGPIEVERDLRAESDQATAQLRRAETQLKFARLNEDRLKAERDGLPEHVLVKLDSLDLGERLRDSTDHWLISHAGVSGDPTPPPPEVVVGFLLGDGASLRKSLKARLEVLAADPSCPAFTSRSRGEVEADLVEARKRITELKAEADAAGEAAAVAGLKQRQAIGGRLT